MFPPIQLLSMSHFRYESTMGKYCQRRLLDYMVANVPAHEYYTQQYNTFHHR
jgi:hypothetical protein